MSKMKWLTTIFVILVLRVTPAAAQDGFVALFDGETLSGWEGAEGRWTVRDGAITGESTEANPLRANTFIVWRAGEVDDFELRLSYRIVGGNSGIQYRSREVSPWVIAGYQADFEAGDTFSGILYDEKGRGILAERGQATRVLPGKKIEQRDPVGDSAALQAAIKKEDWNEYTILARGNRLIHKINGRVTVDVIDEDREQAEQSGLLALQLHAGPPMTVQFKDIRIKRLALAEGKKIVLVSGKPSHRPGEHEFPAGVSALRHALDQLEGVIAADYYEGWPADPSAFDNADAIFFYMDGGARHPMIQGERLAQLDALMKRGVGMACAHYAVEVPADRGGS